MAKAITCLLVLAVRSFGASSAVRVDDILLASYADHTLVYIVSDKAVHYRTARLNHPSRIYVDILNAEIGPMLSVPKIANGELSLRCVRLWSPGRRKVRVVLDLNTAVATRVFRMKNQPGVLVNIEHPASSAASARARKKSKSP